MVDEGTRAFRAALHHAINEIAKDGFQGHVKTFQWLSMRLGLAELNIGILTKDQLRRAIELAHERYRELEKVQERRTLKKREAFKQACRAETRQVERRKRIKKPRRK